MVDPSVGPQIPLRRCHSFRRCIREPAADPRSDKRFAGHYQGSETPKRGTGLLSAGWVEK